MEETKCEEFFSVSGTWSSRHFPFLYSTLGMTPMHRCSNELSTGVACFFASLSLSLCGELAVRKDQSEKLLNNLQREMERISVSLCKSLSAVSGACVMASASGIYASLFPAVVDWQAGLSKVWTCLYRGIVCLIRLMANMTCWTWCYQNKHRGYHS